MNITRVLVVAKRSSYAKLSRKKDRSTARVRRLLKDEDAAVERIRQSHDAHVASLKQVRTALSERGIDFVIRHAPPRSIIEGFDLVLPVGGDGILLAVSHAVRNHTPILGVNSAPGFSVGSLSGCLAENLGETLEAIEEGRIQPVEVQRLRVKVGKKTLPEPVLNDVLFCADNPAVMARYLLMWPEGRELQRSSGVWVATAAGSTAALASSGGPALPLVSKQFALRVREPYAPPGESVRLACAVLDQHHRLSIQSRMFHASIFLDGSHQRYSVPFGETVSFSLHARPLSLFRGPKRGKRRAPTRP